MSDLIERLRQILADTPTSVLSRKRQDEVNAIDEAADELTALRSQVSELRADLEVAREALERTAQRHPNATAHAMATAARATLNTIRKDG